MNTKQINRSINELAKFDYEINCDGLTREEIIAKINDGYKKTERKRRAFEIQSNIDRVNMMIQMCKNDIYNATVAVLNNSILNDTEKVIQMKMYVDSVTNNIINYEQDLNRYCEELNRLN